MAERMGHLQQSSWISVGKVLEYTVQTRSVGVMQQYRKSKIPKSKGRRKGTFQANRREWQERNGVHSANSKNWEWKEVLMQKWDTTGNAGGVRGNSKRHLRRMGRYNYEDEGTGCEEEIIHKERLHCSGVKFLTTRINMNCREMPLDECKGAFELVVCQTDEPQCETLP